MHWIVAALLGTLGVVLGAFGAHGLRARLEPQQLASWQTAVQYHLLHGLVLQSELRGIGCRLDLVIALLR